MAITYAGTVGAAASNPGSSTFTTLSVAVPAGGVPAGRTIVVAVLENRFTTGAVTPSDSRSNTYAALVVGAGNCDVRLFSAYVATALVEGDLVTITLAVAQRSLAFGVYQFAGVLSASPLDRGSVGSKANIAVVFTDSFLQGPTQAGDLLFVAAGADCEDVAGVAAGKSCGFTDASVIQLDAIRTAVNVSWLTDLALFTGYRILADTTNPTLGGTLTPATPLPGVSSLAVLLKEEPGAVYDGYGEGGMGTPPSPGGESLSGSGGLSTLSGGECATATGLSAPITGAV